MLMYCLSLFTEVIRANARADTGGGGRKNDPPHLFVNFSEQRLVDGEKRRGRVLLAPCCKRRPPPQQKNTPHHPSSSTGRLSQICVVGVHMFTNYTLPQSHRRCKTRKHVLEEVLSPQSRYMH